MTESSDDALRSWAAHKARIIQNVLDASAKKDGNEHPALAEFWNQCPDRERVFLDEKLVQGFDKRSFKRLDKEHLVVLHYYRGNDGIFSLLRVRTNLEISLEFDDAIERRRREIGRITSEISALEETRNHMLAETSRFDLPTVRGRTSDRVWKKSVLRE